MSPYLDLYNTAAGDQKAERYGLGSLRFGADSANPNLLASLAQQDKSRRTQEAAGQLSDAFNQRNAAVRGLAMPLVGTSAGREQDILSAIGNQLSGSRSAWANFRPAPSFWQTLLQSTAQNLGSWAGPGGAKQAAAMF